MSDDPLNAVKAARERAGLTLRQLSVAAKTPIATLKRMEVNRVARLGEAVRVAAALDKPPERLFEKAFAVLRARGVENDERRLSDLAWNDSDFRKDMAAAGIDPHPALWTLKAHFRGGAVRTWTLPSADLDRFWGGLDRVRKENPIFFAFDSDVVSVAFNLSQLAHAHALFDPVSPLSEEPDAIQVLLAGERDWLTFDADPDEPDGAEPGAFQGQLTELLTDLESASFGEPFLSFDDVDGERAVFRVDAVSVIEIPQRLLWDYEDKDEDDFPGVPPAGAA